jgi:hypothetical protein
MGEAALVEKHLSPAKKSYGTKKIFEKCTINTTKILDGESQTPDSWFRMMGTRREYKKRSSSRFLHEMG